MNKKLRLIFLLCLLFLPTGCLHYVELGELEVVENISIDYQEDTFQIIATLIEKKEEDLTRKIIKGKGSSIEEAMEKIKTKENKKLYIAHLNLLILTPNAVEQQLESILYYFLENSESRNDFSVALAEDITMMENAENTIDLSKKIQIVEEDLGTSKTCYFEDLLKDLLEKKRSYLPFLTKQEEQITVEGIYLLEKEKLIEHLTGEDVILFNFLHNNIHTTSWKGNKVLSNTTTIRYQNQKIKIAIESILTEEKKNYADELKKAIEEMFSTYQAKNIDIFDFAHAIKIGDYAYFKDHQDTYLQEITLQIEINTAANNQGERGIDFHE